VDRRLAGIQAVQTLSRLNRAHPGKDTTYVLDFVNSSEEILKAFQTYYETAELENVTDPNIIYDMRAKLDAAGHYDDHEIERLVKVELDPESKQGDLIAALTPVADRLLKQFKAAKDKFKDAQVKGDEQASTDARLEMDALTLFKGDIGAFLRLYAFLSQIFDYGNTEIEKRSMFFRRLIPLLDFGREREGIDLTKVVLTHHNLRSQGELPLALGGDTRPKLKPPTDAGSGSVQEKEKARLAEILERINDLFTGVTDDDQLVYVNNVIKGKLLEAEQLVTQAANNTKEQFSDSPDLSKALESAIMDALAAHQTMSKQALASEKVRQGLKDILLGPAQLYEALREKGANSPP
jgi:type I restriction enzyme R subunit